MTRATKLPSTWQRDNAVRVMAPSFTRPSRQSQKRYLASFCWRAASRQGWRHPTAGAGECDLPRRAKHKPLSANAQDHRRLVASVDLAAQASDVDVHKV